MKTISRLGGARAKAVLVAGVALALTGVLVANAGRGAGPPVIRLAADDAATMTAEAEADAARDLALAHPVVHRFELGEPARFPAGEASAWRLEPPSDLPGRARELARGLGLEGELRDDPGDGVRVGPDDGSGPSLWVHRSGDWGYNDPGEVFARACAEPARAEDLRGGGTSDAPDGGGDGEAAPGEPALCAPPDPPEGIPDEHEARRAAEALLGRLDLPGTARVEQVHADEWGAWGLASLELDGVATDLRLSVAFGPEAAVTSASGTLARPVEVDRYPTIDAEAARARLEDRHGGGAGGIEVMPMPMPAEEDVDVEPVRPAEPASPGGSEIPPVAPGGSETPPASPGDPETPVASPDGPDAPVTSQVGPDAPVASPSDPGVTSSAPTRPGVADDTAGPPGSDAGPQERIVTLTSFEPTMMTTVDADGIVWLLPGVTFADEDGGVWPVLTVSDDYLETTVGRPGAGDAPHPIEPGAGGEPGTGVEPGGEGSGDGSVPEPPAPDGGHEEPAAGDDVPAGVRELAEKMVGMTEEEAVARIEEAGHVVRVTARDGESFPVTEDWRTDRINLRVEEGRVVEAKVG